MSDYRAKPSQFRLPAWAHEFLAEESSATGTTKTDVVLEALGAYRRRRMEEELAEGYRALSAANLEEVREWDGTLMDGLVDEGWGRS